jgi:heme-degrading monooxygenase HmoA
MNDLPYYSVIFTSVLNKNTEDYNDMAEKMEALAKKQDGFLGIDSARNHIGITVSYWKNLDAIKNWKAQTDHLEAQQKGKNKWYAWYNVKICKVEREYSFQ